jgi:RNA polymerase sigma-70 factor (ECF subfamily)
VTGDHEASSLQQNKGERMNSEVGAFQDIHDRFRPKILRYLRRMLGDTDAEDVCQEVFMKVDRALPGFRGESSLTTWIYRIATNAALDHVRSASFRQAQANVESSDDDGLTDDPGAGRTEATHLPDTLLVRKDMNDCIRGIVDGLPEVYRTALVLSDLEELTNAEIAGVLSISLDAVKIRIHRARTRLRKEMEKKCVFYRDDRNELACDRKPATLKFPSK